MKRRSFLKYTSSLSLFPLVLNKSMAAPFATLDMLPLMNCQDIDDRVLVVIFLKGGNDGLNTLIPINQYDTYASLRPNIRIQENGTGSYINLDNTLSLDDSIGIHPSMTGFKSLYDSGLANLIQAVGYPNSNGSHFKSTDLWLSGGDGTPANFNINSGWMGRYLETVYAGLAGSPTEANPDPIGIQLGDKKPSLGYYAHDAEFLAANLTQQDPAGLYNLVQSIGTPGHLSVPDSDYGRELAYIMTIENSTNVYAQRITEVFNNGSNSSTVYPTSDLANQLKTIARLISGGSNTKIYLVHTGGFDTHAGQVIGGATHTGTHADLLSNVFESVSAFINDLTNLGHHNRVMCSTFSEFGRRITQNGSLGTDHGNFAPMFLFGSGIQAGVIGTNIDLTDLTSSGNLTSTQLQFDYRQVFKTLIQDWLGADNSVTDTVFDSSYTKISNMVNPTYAVDPLCYHDSLLRETVVKGKLYLEAFYDPLLTQMKNQLETKGLIPLSQPFNDIPFNYTGDESVTILPEGAIDWVLIELRDSQNINTVLGRRAGFVKNTGDIIGLNGGFGLAFSDVTPGNYYVAIYHKSHLAVVSSNPIDFSDLQNSFDFTQDVNAVSGTDQLKLIGLNYVLHAGDFDFDGIVDNTDYEKWKLESSSVNVYSSNDADGNGIINNEDFNLWKKNRNKIGDPTIQN